MSTKVHLVKAMVFPVVMYGCESWTIKKAEHQRIDDFELWCWRRLLRVPWTATRSNQSILKEISAGCSLEGLMLNWNSNTLATWCEELTHLKRPWCWERLRAGGEGDDRGWDGWMASPTQWTLGVSNGQGGLTCCSSWGSKESDTTEQLNWTESIPTSYVTSTATFKKLFIQPSFTVSLWFQRNWIYFWVQEWGIWTSLGNSNASYPSYLLWPQWTGLRICTWPQSSPTRPVKLNFGIFVL